MNKVAAKIDHFNTRHAGMTRAAVEIMAVYITIAEDITIRIINRIITK